MKKFLSSIIVLLFAFSVNAATITKGLIGEQDINRWKGGVDPTTFSRTTSTGGTVVLDKIDHWNELNLRTHEIDVLIEYGNGTSFTKASIDLALSNIGTTTKVTLLLRPGTWVLNANTDYSTYTNVTFKIPNGAILSHGSYTVKIPNIEAGVYQIFNGTGTITLSGIKEVYPEWFGSKADNSTDNTSSLQNAINAAPSGATVKVPLGISRFTNLTIDTTNITLEGDGWGCVLATTMAANSDTAPAIWVKASGVQLRNFKVTWATLPTAAQYGTSVEENDVIAIGTIAYGPPTPAKLSNVTVDNVYVYGGKQHGISLGNTDLAKIINNRIEEVYGTGIWPYNSNNLRVTGNYVYRTADAGIDVTSDLVTYSDDVIISNNNVQKTAIGIGSHGGRGVTISDNVIDNTWASAIYCQESAFYGNPVPSITNVTGNVIRKPFQFYGTGNFHTLDKYTTAAGTYNIIEVYSQSEVNVSGNIINDDADLHTYRVMGIGGTHISITGNVVNSTAAAGIAVGYGTASDYSSNAYLSITGNVLTLNNDAAQRMLFLQSVNGGVISGNHFDCGSGTVYPNGKFINTFWAKDILVTGNNVQNSTARWVDNGNSKNFRFEKNYGILNDTEIVTQPTLIDVSAVSPATLTIAHLQSTFIYASHTTGSTKTYTLPTGTLTDAGVNLLVGEGFEWIFGNYSAAAADTITVAAGVDHTIWGSGVIQSQNATTGGLYGCVGKFRTVKTAANTFITYRIN